MLYNAHASDTSTEWLIMTCTSRLTATRSGSAAVALSLTILLAGCSGSDTSDPTPTVDSPSPTRTPSDTPSATSSQPTEEATEAGQTLEVSIAGDGIKPNGAALDLAVGEPLTIRFETDRAGELHVHSRPQQIVSFDAGTSTRELVIENPGAVEVEEHQTGMVVAQIKVR